MDITTENREEPMFQLEEDEAYAGTEPDVWHAMRFFNRLEVVDLEKLEPDSMCSICMQPYDDPKDGSIKHVPVRLPCSHVFGKECLATWTTPLGAWEHNGNSGWEEKKGWFETRFVTSSSSTDCPLCRRSHFQKPRFAESALGLEARLILWDLAYEKIGCLRSPKEEQSRADLVQYVEFNRRANGIIVEAIDQRWRELEKYHRSAKVRLYDFISRRKGERVLTPTQDRLHRNLEHISLTGPHATLDDPSFEEFQKSDFYQTAERVHVELRLQYKTVKRLERELRQIMDTADNNSEGNISRSSVA